MKRDLHLIYHILETIEKIEIYSTEGRSNFFESSLHQDAILRNLHTMSESVSVLSDELKQRYASVDWLAIKKFRNVIVHDYLSLDLNDIWEVIQTDLPLLKADMERILKELEKGE